MVPTFACDINAAYLGRTGQQSGEIVARVDPVSDPGDGFLH